MVIAVSGWLTENRTPSDPWRFLPSALAPFSEVYALRWESDAQRALGSAITDFATKTLAQEGTKSMIGATVASSILMAVAYPLAILSMADLVDNPWTVAMDRARRSGVLLADVILAREQGERPVTLVGYSMGAAVIFHALEELARRALTDADPRTAWRARGAVLDVFLLGAPVAADAKRWTAARSVVCGRMVNAYSTRDWILRFLYRAAHAQYAVAGLGAVDVNSVENYDVTALVPGHHVYENSLAAVLRRVGWGVT